ncbi:hypothetical protein F4777DRAFT_93017 [Nemania sp. FL0916]|nr:hypothetical protein F4777DRAFT_93017 [Nemania sp. FL0916]
MQYSLALIPALLGVAAAAPQGVTEPLKPTGAAPAGCSGSFDGNFEISVAKVTKEKRSMPERRAVCGSEGTLVLTLKDGTTLDAKGRTGYIASNYQFQFDAPAQAGTIYNSGFSVCENNLLALGSSKTFYQCQSGTFYNLYDRTWAPQCEPVSIIAVPCGSKDSAGQSADGQVIGTTVVQTTIVTALPDGQPQVVTTAVSVPVYSTYVPVSEYTDGQVQVTPSVSESAPVSYTATATVAPPTETTAVSTPAPASTPLTNPITNPGPISTSAPAVTPSESSSVPEVTPTSESSASAPASSSSSAPAASSSAPPASGASHVAAGSMGALAVGMFVAFLCL